MSLELDPVELGFRRPFTQEVEEKLRLRNPNSAPVAFKVKTTAPKQYCVRPNSGRIEPGQQVEVSVLLQAMKEEPPMDAKCRDKFLVQSVAVSANDELTNVSEVWSNIERTAKSSIQEKKIRVNFLQASSGGAAAAYSTPQRASTNALASDEQPPSYASPMTSNNTPVQAGSYASRDNKSAEGPPMSAPAAAVASVASVVPTSTEELKAQLADAQARISSLTSQASEGLRQRKSAAVTSNSSSSSGGSAMSLQQPPAGVPVPVVAGLCLLSFLLAYILF